MELFARLTLFSYLAGLRYESDHMVSKQWFTLILFFLMGLEMSTHPSTDGIYIAVVMLFQRICTFLKKKVCWWLFWFVSFLFVWRNKVAMRVRNVSGLSPIPFLTFFPMTFYPGSFKLEISSSVVYSYQKKKKEGSSGTFLAYITKRVQEYPPSCGFGCS